MKLYPRLLAVLVVVLVLAASAFLAWSKGTVDIAMILWRGMTEGEIGYQAKLNESGNYAFRFTVIDANQDRGKLDRIINKLDYKKYKLIYAFGTIVTAELKKKIKDTPIVFNAVARPVEAGLIKSWEHSGNNVTGVSNMVSMASILNTISMVMRINRLGFLYNPEEPNSVIQLAEAQQLQKAYKFTMFAAPIEHFKAIPAVIKKLADEKVDAVLLPADSLIMSQAKIIVTQFNNLKIPTVALLPDLVEDPGAFIGVGPDYTELGQLAAYKTLAILDGKKPKDIPTSHLERLHIRVNLKTSKKIGVNVPVQILRIATVVK